MPPKTPRKTKEPVDPTSLRRSARVSGTETNTAIPTSKPESSSDDSTETVVPVVFETTRTSPVTWSPTTSPVLGENTITEFEQLLTRGPSSEVISPHTSAFNIADAIDNFNRNIAGPSRTGASSNSPSVISLKDTESDSTLKHTGCVSSDDEPDPDAFEFNPSTASTGKLPIRFDLATFDLEDSSDYIPEDSSQSTDSSVESIESSEVQNLLEEAALNEPTMAGEENDEDRRNPPPPPPVIPVPADPMAMFMAMMQRQQDMMNAQMSAQRDADLAREERQERVRREEMAELRAEMLENRRRPASSTPRSGAKVPTFNLDKDKPIFFTWKEKWEAYIISHGLNEIENNNERMMRIRAELTTAMSDHTLRWFTNQGFTAEQNKDANFLINALEQYIRGTTNPLVQNVELLSLKKSADETVEHFVERIKEKAKLCELNNITDAADYFPMLCLIAGHDNSDTRKKLMLEKVKTFASFQTFFEYPFLLYISSSLKFKNFNYY